jgi:hypothetical protein
MRDGGGNIPEPEVPNIPEPPVVPNPPSIESAVPARERRIGPNDNLVGFTARDWRQLFEDQGHDGVPERVRRAQDAVRRGREAANAEFANVFGDENRVREGRIRGDRADAVTRYEAQLQRLEQNERRAKETYDRYQNRPNDGQLLQAQRDYIAALAARQRFQEQRQALDAGLAMDAPQPLDPEMARKAEQRVKDAIEGRQRILAEHLNRRYGEGNAPWKEMTLEKRQDLLRKAQRGTPEEKRAAVAELEAWATAMYNHEEIRGSNGKTYRTVARASLSPGNASISVGVSIQVKDANGRWSEVGTSSRSILLNENKVYNGTMFIRAAGHKNNGIQTIYNQHAFMYAKAAGFEKFGVTAVDDGPYVWGRVGFETNGPISGGAVGRMAAQLSAFRRGEESIIKNEEDANIIKYLLDKYDDDPGSVRHMDFIYALTNAGQTKAQKKARDREMRDWFVSNMPMGGGTFYLDKNMIKADPRD